MRCEAPDLLEPGYLQSKNTPKSGVNQGVVPLST
jgi:hypothetical protein